MTSYVEFEIKSLRYSLSEEGLTFPFACDGVSFYYPATTKEENAIKGKIEKRDWTGVVHLSEGVTIALAEAIYENDFRLAIHLEAKRFAEFKKIAEIKISHPEVLLRCRLSNKPYWGRDQGRLVTREDPSVNQLTEGAVIEWWGVLFTLSS